MTARGSGTGLSGGATPVAADCHQLRRMNRVVRLDTNDHVVLVQPGLTLRELGEHCMSTGLRYPVLPGELSDDWWQCEHQRGGNACRATWCYRQHVLGLELVLADGTVLVLAVRSLRSSSGYDLTQLVTRS